MITPAGQAFFQVLRIFAELERSIAMAARFYIGIGGIRLIGSTYCTASGRYGRIAPVRR
jgi:hypothetical protein